MISNSDNGSKNANKREEKINKGLTTDLNYHNLFGWIANFFLFLSNIF